MFLKKLLAIASVLSCALIAQGAHALEPAVLFTGGNELYNWQASGELTNSPTFPLYLSDGFQINDGPGICNETSQAQAVFNQSLPYSNILAVHLLVGADDAMGTDDANPPAFVFQQWQACYTSLVNSIIASHRKVILGTIPFTFFNDPKPYNDFIFTLAAEKGATVIDYYTLLRHANDNFEGTQYFIPASGTALPSISAVGYQLMTATVNNVINQVVNGVKLKSGFVGNDALQGVGDPPHIPQTGLNTVAPGTKQHWQAYGQYSDGSTATIQSANINGVYGTWTSSNPAVVSIDPYGASYTLGLGTANIHFTTLSGVTLNEWTMNVVATGPN
jgi:hypothetical protein